MKILKRVSTIRKSLGWVLNVGNYPDREKVKGIRQKEHLGCENKHSMFKGLPKRFFILNWSIECKLPNSGK